MADADENELRIVTDELNVTLCGDSEEIHRAYVALKGILDHCYASTIRAHVGGRRNAGSGGRSGNTQPLYPKEPMPKVTEPMKAIDTSANEKSASRDDDGEMSAAVRAVAPETRNANAFIQLVLRRDKYTKVHLLERQELADSFLGRSIDASDIERIYLDRPTKQRIQSKLEIGETLWRELTAEGRREVERRSKEVSEESGD